MADFSSPRQTGKNTTNEKNTTTWRTAIREAGISRHHGGPIEGLWNPLKHNITAVSRGLRGVPPIMLKDASNYNNKLIEIRTCIHLHTKNTYPIHKKKKNLTIHTYAEQIYDVREFQPIR